MKSAMYRLPSALGRPSNWPECGLRPLLQVRLFDRRSVPAVRGDDDLDRQVVLPGELEVALIVRRHAHHDAGAVRQQHVVPDQDRHALSVQPVYRVGAGEQASLDLFGRHAFDLSLAARLVHVGLDFVSVLGRRQIVDQRVLGGQHHERHAEDRVDARGEGRQRRLIEAVLGYVELDVDALAAADPVCLHDVDLLRPVDLGMVQQLVRVLRHAEQPLVQLAANDLGVAPLAAAVHDLLVGQDGIIGRAPVGGREIAVGQAGLQELEEYPLVPPVVLGDAGHQLAVPVVERAHRAELPAHLFYVAQGPPSRMDSTLDRGVLGVQAEGIEPHRMQDVIALHPHEPGVGVRARHGVPVADVEVARRVRVHGELVPLGARVVVPDLVEPVRVPTVLPLRLYLGVTVAPLRNPRRCGHPYTPGCDPGTAKNKNPVRVRDEV